MIDISSLFNRLQTLKENIARVEARRDFIYSHRVDAEKKTMAFSYDADLQQKSSEIIKSWLNDLLRVNVDSIASLATSGLKNVISDQDLVFKIKQEFKYNRVSMAFIIEDCGVEGNPMSSFGGGAVLMASLILRLAIMSRMNMGGLLLLDETLFALANKYVPAAADFMRHLSEETGVNIFMVTHNEEFMQNAHISYEGFSVSTPCESGNSKSLHLRKRM